MDNEDAIILHKWMTVDLHLTGGGLTVFAIIFNHSKDGCSSCRSPIGYLTSWAGLTERQVYRVLKVLEEQNLVIKEYENTDKGRIVQYQVNRATIRELRGLTTQEEPTSTPNKKSEQKSEKPAQDNEINESFEVLWQEYQPVETRQGMTDKGPKKLARERYSKFRQQKVPAEDILRGALNYIACCYRNGTRTAHLATFLSQERWKDWMDWTDPADDLGI